MSLDDLSLGLLAVVLAGGLGVVYGGRLIFWWFPERKVEPVEATVTSTVPRRPIAPVIPRPLGHPIGACCCNAMCAYCRRN